MPISFNETVPTITDILENANILNNQIEKFLNSAYFIDNEKLDIVLLNKNYAKSMINEYFETDDNDIDCKFQNIVNNFLSTTNSEYVAWL
jgi:hypothetical protein